MIITRSPLRITLGGGGTDLPSYYRQHGGFLISAAIDRYVYVTVMRPFVEGIYLKYTKLEHVKTVDEVQHPIIRECLRHFKATQIEITTLADIPSGTGLGSSGSFTTALLKALHAHHKTPISTGELADFACEIEIDKLGEPIGKQDQYIAAYGGVTCFTFDKDYVKVSPLAVSIETLHALEDNLLLFFTGFVRSASDVLRSPETDDYLHTVKQNGLDSHWALINGDLPKFVRCMREGWNYKRLSNKSNAQINAWHDLGMANGALGGKLVGAGGGGFLLFYTEDHKRLRAAMAGAGLAEVRFRFDFEGTRVMMS